ncbi:hypothetical protein K493DRAFT_307188 [Basidiobolus meristosporus CBS 931.73]|uniref:Uncharacterized protein n=1 Tax=Basidiobolus meristosporus CBS 931.73 TaxID=1314790 RepID=A0A1Y1XKF2_9FUNG|nr:hypothetical protein K493DRAFT_307188 [Basidiobolus meristosporus CBS 931.73]|eukprot:ORX85824.1 hypothetical protein K493DRAFT_307188 [Basidiobolus meristosporus CBS 931.73]
MDPEHNNDAQGDQPADDAVVSRLVGGEDISQNPGTSENNVLTFIEDICKAAVEATTSVMSSESLTAQENPSPLYTVNNAEEMLQEMVNLQEAISNLDLLLPGPKHKYYSLYEYFSMFARQQLRSNSTRHLTNPIAVNKHILRALRRKMREQSPEFNYHRFKRILDRAGPLFMLTNFLGPEILNYEQVFTANRLANLKAKGLRSVYSFFIGNPNFRNMFADPTKESMYDLFSAELLFDSFKSKYWTMPSANE